MCLQLFFKIIKFVALGLWIFVQTAHGQNFITLAAATSTRNAGLLDWILPLYQQKTGVKVRVVSVGTGAALRLGQNGDVDILWVHHRPSEEKFIAAGYGVKRYDVMYNNFVLVGPKHDPAGVKNLASITKAFARIAITQPIFVARGDDSGTDFKEKALWHQLGLEPTRFAGRWYRQTGAGMGASLNIASAMQAYILADRGSWLAFKNRNAMQILVAGDRQLFNPYSIILVNPNRHPHIKAEQGQAFIDWLVSGEGQQAIAAFRLSGENPFTPNAKPSWQ